MARTILALAGLLAGIAACGPAPLVPADAPVPPGFETPEFRVRPISVADAEKDYEAVIESVDVIHAALLSDRWPTPAFTLDANRRDLERKERHFAARRGFTYTVVSPDESRVLGCVYVNRGRGGPDVAVFLWVRRTAPEGMDARLESAVRAWVAREWPFQWVVYPGRKEPERAASR